MRFVRDKFQANGDGRRHCLPWNVTYYAGHCIRESNRFLNENLIQKPQNTETFWNITHITEKINLRIFIQDNNRKWIPTHKCVRRTIFLHKSTNLLFSTPILFKPPINYPGRVEHSHSHSCFFQFE